MTFVWVSCSGSDVGLRFRCGPLLEDEHQGSHADSPRSAVCVQGGEAGSVVGASETVLPDLDISRGLLVPGSAAVGSKESQEVRARQG